MPHRGKKVRRRKPVKTKQSRSSVLPETGLKTERPKLPSCGESFSSFQRKDGRIKKARLSSANTDLNAKSQSENDAVATRFQRKDGRIIIRNLPFQVTEDSLRKHLESYGQLEEVNILYRPDGKLVGCGFVQFSSKESAQKAIVECNAKPFLGRIVIFDWAVPKNVFKNNFKIPTKADKPIECSEIKSSKFKEAKEGMEKDAEEEAIVETGYDSNCEEFSNNDNIEDQKDWNTNKNIHSAERQKPFHNDVNDGCTVFLKNVSFQTTNEELKNFMESFGPVKYALICMDPLTEHSKGTAFVKFKKKESADACLAAEGEELTLDCSLLSAVPALSREEARKRIDDEKLKSPKDARNLYLVKEGVIMAGSKSAHGVSVSDMATRVKLDQWKTQILQNLKMFVSRYRLVIHNLPPNFTDHHLRKLFKKNAGPEAVIKEAKIMRDMKKIESNGLGQSKGYGFVSFTKHEHALQALRNVNNNPEMFSPDKRPIVSFSIENRAIINAKQKRLLKSQAMNPLFQGGRKKNSSDDNSVPVKDNHRKTGKAYIKQEKHSEELVPNFGGLAANPEKSKMRLRHKFHNQLKVHTDNVKKDKQKRKALQQQSNFRNVSESRSQAVQERKLKRKVDLEDVTFSNLVKKYKKQLTAAPQKWYEGDVV